MSLSDLPRGGALLQAVVVERDIADGVAEDRFTGVEQMLEPVKKPVVWLYTPLTHRGVLSVLPSWSSWSRATKVACSTDWMEASWAEPPN